MQEDNMRRFKRNRLTVTGCILLCLTLILYLGFISLGTQVEEEVTGRKFVAYVSTRFKGGDVTYFCKSGIFLHSAQKFEAEVLMEDVAALIVDSDEIYINTTFMGPGAHFPLNKNADYKISLKAEQEYSFRKENSDYVERLKLNSHEITYYDTDSEEERVIPIEENQYMDIKKMIESMALAQSDANQEYTYYLKWRRKDDTMEMVYVDGEKIFEEIKEKFFKK